MTKFYSDAASRILNENPASLAVIFLSPEHFSELIDHFTVVCSVPWPLNRSEAGADLVLLQTFLPFMCNKSCYSHANKPVNTIIYI